MTHARCEDAPCCGHNDSICGQTLGAGPLEDMPGDDGTYYCDVCGCCHAGPCPDDYEEDDEYEEELT